ncbi:hypothetical protein BJ170DRAFT_734515 [Xylariales sp. AK1849]|nr:hypothetical protein BJ170DRAFT_734515 [Xylariales sp. AK1849]
MSSSSSAVDVGAHTSSDDATPAPHIPDNRNSTATPSPPQSAAQNDDASADLHRCFICLGDESEESLPADWVTPCNCTLEGHQSCMLTWVADLEMQSKGVKCPQCKSRIDIIDRWDPAVQLSNTVTRYLSGLSPWLLLTFGLGGISVSSAVYGLHALEVFAGPEAAVRYIFLQPEPDSYLNAVLGRLRPYVAPRDAAPRAAMLGQEGYNTGQPVNLAHFCSLMLIAPALVLNRMHLGEAVMIPSSLMYAMFLSDHKTDMLVWPPSPQRTLATFPVVEALYFHAYRVVVKKLDEKLQALTSQTRNLQGATAEQVIADRDAEAPLLEPEGDNLIDIQIGLALGDDEDDEDNAAPQPARANAPADNIPALARPNRAANGISSLLNHVTGALLWPIVSSSTGSLLRLVLPASWTMKPLSGRTTGLLQERWGRSLVGGCLFVVLKDAFFLYVKWRKTVNRPYRRIRNVDRRARVG